MYTNIFVDRKSMIVHLWDDTEGYKTFPYEPYAYQRCPGGEYKSLYGDELEKIHKFNEHDPNLFESDVAPEMRILIDKYLDNDEVSNDHKVVVIDIEVSTEGGFPDVFTGNNPITAIALYDQITKKYFSFILDPDQKIPNSDENNVDTKSFKNEEGLLNTFLNKWEELSPAIVTGWSTNFFDIPYIYNRIRAVLGKAAAYRLSPIKLAYQNKYNKKMVIAGLSCIDYIDLYKKFIGVIKPSWTLNNVAKDEELSVQKLTYKGSLKDLYKNDLPRYVEYNLTDVKVVVELDKKYDFLHLARSVCHKGHVPYEWFQMSSRWIDGAILTYLKRNNLVAPNRPIGGREEYEKHEDEDGDDNTFEGAFVKEPIKDLYDWIYSADITSLYPSTIITLNISPETKIGKIENWDKLEFDIGNIPTITFANKTYSAEDFKSHIANYNYSISSNGVIYSQTKLGVVPTILDTWFSERVQYRKLALQYAKEGNKEKEGFYDRRQKRQKIFLNSVYGTLGLPIFRFYDRDNAEATTLSGQHIIKSAEKLVNHIYAERFKAKGMIPPQTDFVVYIDTDSLYVSSLPLARLEPEMPDMVKFTIDLVTEMSTKINELYAYMVPRIFNVSPTKNRIKIVPDVIAEKALWTKKKRYAMLKVYDMEKNKPVVDKKGNKGKLEVKGIDVVRSSFPSAFRKFAGDMLESILRGVSQDILDERIMNFEETLDSYSILDLAKTTSVQFISKDKEHNYNPPDRKIFEYIDGSPAQVKAALAYNDLLKVWKIHKQYEPIMNSSKIKWVYLLPNDFCITQIAMKADDTDPDQMLDFITTHIDRNKMYSQELQSKLCSIYQCIKWAYPNRGSQIAAKIFNFDEEW